jgi:hypothetical protein
MDFKFFQHKDLEHNNFILFQPAIFTPSNVEFCFQFGDEEPIVFAHGPNDCTIRISPTGNGQMTFNDNGKVFKLFARERES